MTVNDKLRNTTIQHAHFIEQYKNHEIKKVLALLNKSDNSLRDQLKKYKGRTDTITSKRLKLMKQDIKDIIGESKQVLSTKIDDLAINFGNLESKWLGDIIHDAVPDEVPISFIQPAPTQILAAVKAIPFNNTTLQDMITTWSTSKIKLFTNATQQAFIQGQGIDDVVRILFGTRALQYTDGLVDGTRRQIRTQVRTAMNHFSSTARDLTYKQNSDLIKGVQWVATLDGRTTLQCINLDGKVDYEDGSRRELNGLRPPAHYNCRSTTVPVIKSLKELGLSDKEFSSSTRASMNGQVPETKRYKDWFKDQPADFQQQVLGKKRYDLYKKDGLPLDKFIENGQTLTLNQLAMVDKQNVSVRRYNNVNNLDEAQQVFVDKLGVKTIDIAGLNETDGLQVVNRFGDVIGNDILDNFPQLEEYRKNGINSKLNKLLITNDSAGYGTAQYHIREKKFVLPKESLNLATKPEELLISQHTPFVHNVGTDLNSIIRHEYGHHVMRAMLPAEKYRSVFKIYDKAMESNAVSKISKYAVTSADEMFAEAFSAYTSPLYGKDATKFLPDWAEEMMKDIIGDRTK